MNYPLLKLRLLNVQCDFSQQSQNGDIKMNLPRRFLRVSTRRIGEDHLPPLVGACRLNLNSLVASVDRSLRSGWALSHIASYIQVQPSPFRLPLTSLFGERICYFNYFRFVGSCQEPSSPLLTVLQLVVSVLCRF